MGAAESIPMDDHWQDHRARPAPHAAGSSATSSSKRVGKQWPLDLAGELTRERGRLVIAGYHQDGPRQVNMQLWNWRGLDVINAHERDPEDLSPRHAATPSKPSPAARSIPSPLYTHTFPLERLRASAGDDARSRPDGS